MPFAYAYDAIQKIVHARFEGTVTAADLLDYLDTIISDGNIAPGFVELADMAAVDDLQLRYEDTGPFADLWRRYQEKGSAGTIVFVPDDANYGSLRMAQTTILSSDEAEKTPMVVVRTREEVVEQLKLIRG